MSYHIYTTKGLILSERAYKEADKLYTILTRDLGLVRASALGVRKEASKLRGNLSPLSLSKVSLVRGKEYWRLTSAEVLKKLLPSAEVARPLALLERLVQGESSHPELFDAIEGVLEKSSEDKLLELRLVSQILFHLGYLRESDLALSKVDLIKAVNQGLYSSHLV